jgi:hypothetical protein
MKFLLAVLLVFFGFPVIVMLSIKLYDLAKQFPKLVINFILGIYVCWLFTLLVALKEVKAKKYS